MTAYQRTIPSAVLGEYLSDVRRFYAFAEPSPRPKDINRVTSASLLGHNLNRLYGREVAIDYWRWLLERAKRQHEAEAEAYWKQRRTEAAKVKATAPKVEPKPKAERKPWQEARRHNERRMREAILKVVGRHGWTPVGERKLAELADNMKHRTARGVLDRMAEDGQIKLDRSKERGRRTGVYVVREHPCWSDQKHAQSLAQSKLSDQLRG